MNRRANSRTKCQIRDCNNDYTVVCTDDIRGYAGCNKRVCQDHQGKLVEKYPDYTRTLDNLCTKCAIKMKKPVFCTRQKLKYGILVMSFIACIGILLTIYVVLRQQFDWE